MSTNTIETEKATTPEPDAPQAKGKRAPTKKTKPAKKARQPNKASKPKANRANERANVIALMKRAKGATLAEIMKATGWQPYTVHGCVSILGKKGDGMN